MRVRNQPKNSHADSGHVLPVEF
ncbi:uncharacterized protein METZ01_LOCUS105479 [marine metagenome]|uniref:Uncharacterized protein n=1 Tax=marine metagenome TaxID=408172 RepID=A0A381WJD2_9ZZZZ